MGVSKSYRLALTVGCSALALTAAASAARATDFIGGDTLLISTTTYQDVGAVAGLVAGMSLHWLLDARRKRAEAMLAAA